MGQIAVTINARNYKIACEDGQEQHLAMLAQFLDTKVGELIVEVGQIGDTRLLLMAGLLVADELSDTREELEELRGALAAGRAGSGPGPADPEAAATASSLQSMAQRIDTIAAGLERT